MFHINIIEEATLKNSILNHTPLLTKAVDPTLNAFVDIYDLGKKYNSTSTSAFNQESLDVLLKYKITNITAVEKLIQKDKLKIDNAESILDKYR